MNAFIAVVESMVKSKTRSEKLFILFEETVGMWGDAAICRNKGDEDPCRHALPLGCSQSIPAADDVHMQD